MVGAVGDAIALCHVVWRRSGKPQQVDESFGKGGGRVRSDDWDVACSVEVAAPAAAADGAAQHVVLI